MDALVLVLNVFELNASVSMASMILHRELKNILLQKESRASRLFCGAGRAKYRIDKPTAVFRLSGHSVKIAFAHVAHSRCR